MRRQVVGKIITLHLHWRLDALRFHGVREDLTDPVHSQGALHGDQYEGGQHRKGLHHVRPDDRFETALQYHGISSP